MTRSRFAQGRAAPHSSIFEAEGTHLDGGVVVKDLLDEGHLLHVRTTDWRASAEQRAMFAARFVDRPWHISFGIVLMLRKSEAVAILIALSHNGDLADKRDSLHELVYLCHLHHTDLVVAALAPIISVLSHAIDASDAKLEEIVSGFSSAIILPE